MLESVALASHLSKRKTASAQFFFPRMNVSVTVAYFTFVARHSWSTALYDLGIDLFNERGMGLGRRGC